MRKLTIILFTLYVVSSPVTAQQSFRLNKGWQFLQGDLGGIWEAVRPVSKGAPESVPLWTSVSLPHCVNALDAVDPDVNYYQGPSWYRTELTINNPYPNGRTMLHFEGVGQKSEVYVYTGKVGEHVGGYDEWTVDITDAVEDFKKQSAFEQQFEGRIPIAVRVDNSRDLEMIPSDLSDFNLYGGIYRYLNLVYQPEVSFVQVFVDPNVDTKGISGRLKLKPQFYNPSKIAEGTLSVEVSDPSGQVVAKHQAKVNLLQQANPIELRIKRPKLWSDVSPDLYLIDVTLNFSGGQVKHQDEFGFRNFEFVEHGPFKLNGKRLLLRGTHRHEDHAGVGAAMTEQMIREEMILMKEMGVNFIRLGHYQQSRIVLELCDSLGILVWEEIPWCRGGLGGEKYKEQAKEMLTNMVRQHYNHPSIIIWGLGNENDWPGDFAEFDKEKIRNFMKELNDLSHTLDPSRKTAIRRCDFCKDIVDVYSPSIWAGWYRGAYTDYKTVSEEEMKKVKHFLHVEWGGDSHARRHAENPDDVLGKIVTGKGADERAGDASLFGGPARVSKDGDWSESYICNLIDWHLSEQQSMDWLTGTAYWPFKDFSTPVRPENPVPYVNQKGVVERDFTRKEAFYLFQSWWTQKPMAHIYGHTWPVRWGKPDELKMIKVYSNCEVAELFVNGKSVGMKKRNGKDFPAAGLRWMVNPREGMNDIRVIAKQGKTSVEDSISFYYETRQWEAPYQLLLEQVEDHNDQVTVQVKLVDKNGVQCLDARNYVKFGLTGDGSLIDKQGTSTGSSYVQLYNGRASIKINKQKGRSVVSVKCEDIPTVFLDLK